MIATDRFIITKQVVNAMLPRKNNGILSGFWFLVSGF